MKEGPNPKTNYKFGKRLLYYVIHNITKWTILEIPKFMEVGEEDIEIQGEIVWRWFRRPGPKAQGKIPLYTT